MPTSPPNASEILPGEASGHDSSRLSKCIVAAMLSGVLPGLGQLILGRKTIANVFFISFLALALTLWPLRLPRWYWGLVLFVAGVLVLAVVSAWLAVWHSVKGAARLSLLIVVPASFAAAAFVANVAPRAAGFVSYQEGSSSMEPTIHERDNILVDTHLYRHVSPKAGDIVALWRPGWGLVTFKRVIATAGSTISGKDNVVAVNGLTINEPYVRHSGEPPPKFQSDFGPIPILQGKLFVMGDNRDISLDSRSQDFGLINVTGVIGKALYVYRPAATGKPLNGSASK